jgi:hypothetical protein
MSQLKIDRGTSYTRSFDYLKNGVAHSLVGATVRFTVKATEFSSDATDADAVIAKNLTNGDANGHINIVFAPSDTATISPGKYFYDIKVDELSNGVNVYKVDEGTIKLGGSPSNRLS